MSVRCVAGFSALTLAILTPMAAGCSSGPGGKDAGYTPPTQAELAAGVLPCKGIHTGYPGDGQCIEAPDPTKGFQFHYGPSSYDDPKEVAKYLLMPGQETTDCVFFPTPNTKDVYFNEYHSRLRPGSHHLLLYVQPVSGSPHTSTAPEACNQGIQTRNLFGATSPTMDVKQIDPAPENQGLAVKIPATQQAVAQLHVINVGSAPILREAWANILYTDPSSVKELADPIFFVAGVTMSIQVGQTLVSKGTATVPQNAGKDFRLVAAIPHTHAHTPRFSAYKTVGGKRELILEQFGVLDVPNEPHLVYFDSVMQNPLPNEASHLDGAFTGDIYLKPGDTIEWECEQTNDGIGANGQRFTSPLQFTEQAYTGEMCNLFGLYAPSTGGPWQGFGL
jgi:hypothetical protein